MGLPSLIQSIHTACLYVQSYYFRMPQSLPNTSIYHEVGSSALREVKAYLDHLQEVMVEKEAVFRLVKTAIDKEQEGVFANIRPYGSTSVLLCEAESDVDICVQMPATMMATLAPVAQQRHVLATLVLPAISTVFDELAAGLDREVPVITGTVLLESNNTGKTRVDISCNEVGLAKTRHLLGLYAQDPVNFVAFAALVQWARYAGLIKHLGSDDHVFETAVMYAFIVHLLFSSSPAGVSEAAEVERLQRLSLTQLAAHMNQAVSSSPEGEEALVVHAGHLIHNFFRQGHSLVKQDLELVWPLVGVPPVHVSQADVIRFRKVCSQSMHALLATRDMRATIENAADCCSTQTTYYKKLSLTLSNAMGQALEFHGRELSFKTKATVTISEEEGEDRLVLRAEGSRRALSDLRVELTALSNTTRAFNIGLPARKSAKYFMVGSTFMMIRNSPTFTVKLSFGDARGGYHPPHQSRQRSSPLLQFCSPVPTADWIRDTAVLPFREKMEKQLAALPLDRHQLINTLEGRASRAPLLDYFSIFLYLISITCFLIIPLPSVVDPYWILIGSVFRSLVDPDSYSQGGSGSIHVNIE